MPGIRPLLVSGLVHRGNPRVGFCESSLGAGHTSHPLRLLVATFLMVLRLAMRVTSLPTGSQPSAPSQPAVSLPPLQMLPHPDTETSLIPNVLTLWVILIRVTQCAGAMEDGKGTLAKLSPMLLYLGPSQHQWVPSNSPGPSMASHNRLHLHIGFFLQIREAQKSLPFPNPQKGPRSHHRGS